MTSASYEAQPTWTRVMTADSYIPTSVGRFNMTQTKYDNLGRVYRMLRFPGSETTKHFEVNYYYDRRGNRVCSGDRHSAHTEMAYDGVGRQYQTRTVLDVKDYESPYETSGAFKYNAPQPHPNFSAVPAVPAVPAGGEGVSGEGVITLSHTQYEGTLAIASHSVELNHDNTDGISLSRGNVTGGIRSTTFTWYDAVNRPSTMANYGAGNGGDNPCLLYTSPSPRD